MLRRAAVVAALAAAAAPALAADTATVRAQAGRTYAGTLEAVGDAHVIQLDDFVLPGLVLTIALKADRSDLEPDITLESPSAADLTPDLVPYRKDTATKVAVRKFPMPSEEGRYLLRVRGKNGTTGAYTLKITAGTGTLFQGTGTLPGSAESNVITVHCPTEAAVRLKVSTLLGELQPVYGITYRSDGLATPLAVSTKPGQASFVAPVSGDQSIAVNGAGDTEGTFRWTARLKVPKPPRTPVRVNGAPVSYPDPGPLPAKVVVTSGQSIRGIETDGVDLAWREVRTTGGGPNADRNSIEMARVTGAGRRSLANNFATDASAGASTFAMGPRDVAVFAEGRVFQVPRDGTGEVDLGAFGGVTRALCTSGYALFATDGDLRRYDLDDGTPTNHTTQPFGIYGLCLGGRGYVYVSNDAGDPGEEWISTETVEDANEILLEEYALGSVDEVTAIQARGRDVFVAVSTGGNRAVHRVDAADDLPTTTVFSTSNPLGAMAVDDAHVYVIEVDGTDGARVVQVPRGGGVRQVLLRDDVDGGFTLRQDDIAAAGGYVYVAADVAGNDAILRVRRSR
jgi:type II secretory pathway pseudopilin PulG